MFHFNARGREEHGLAPVVPVHQVRRRAAFPVDPDDRAVAFLVTLMAAPDRQLVACLRLHGPPPYEVSY
jgi:hypothetical protein